MKKNKLITIVVANVALLATVISCKNASSGGGESTPSKPTQKMVFVKGGTIVGADYTNKYAGVFIKDRTVTLSDFYISNFLVTQEEYKEVMTDNKAELNVEPSLCKADSTAYALENPGEQGQRPVENVTWYDAVFFCNQKSQNEHLECVYSIVVKGKSNGHITDADVTVDLTKNGYRLPTEAEWEYAARGGDPNAPDWNYVFSGADTASDTSGKSVKNSGLDSVGWYRYNNITGTTGETDVISNPDGKGTHQVGLKKANKLGLYDMSGNVWEWCYDLYGDINKGSVTDFTGVAAGSSRVDRGGSWYNSADLASVSFRSYDDPNFYGEDLGFRVVRSAN